MTLACNLSKCLSQASLYAFKRIAYPPGKSCGASSVWYAASEASSSSPRPVARTRKLLAPKNRKAKPTMNHQAAKAAAKVAATKVKSKTRKGR